MREFKPMVKMETTEPTVELKLKKGGAVKKMADGGMPMGAMIGAPKGGMIAGAKPKKPSLAARRRAMMASGAAGAPAGRAESMMSAMPAMKKGGRAKGGEMESPKVHKAEMKELSGIKKELTKHEDMPASKGHRGLKTGGVAMANAGGFRKGGAAKKFAEGGRVQHDGGPEQMKQGKKKPAGPVSINQLSGTYKKGGAVMMAVGGSTQSANAAAQRAAMQKNAEISAQVAAQKAVIKPSVNASQLAMEKRRADQIKASVAAAAVLQSRSQSRAAAAAKTQIAGLDPKTGRFAPGSMEYMAPQVTVSKSMPSPVPSAMPMPEITPMPKPVPSVVPSSGYAGIDGRMRRGGKVQYNGKKRGGAVC